MDSSEGFFRFLIKCVVVILNPRSVLIRIQVKFDFFLIFLLRCIKRKHNESLVELRAFKQIDIPRSCLRKVPDMQEKRRDISLSLFVSWFDPVGFFTFLLSTELLFNQHWIFIELVIMQKKFPSIRVFITKFVYAK